MKLSPPIPTEHRAGPDPGRQEVTRYANALSASDLSLHRWLTKTVTAPLPSVVERRPAPESTVDTAPINNMETPG